jgi:hypothetical protein
MAENQNTISFLDYKDQVIKVEQIYYNDLSSNDVAFILNKQSEIREKFGKQTKPNMFALGASMLLDKNELEQAEDWGYIDEIYKNFDKGNVKDTQKLNMITRTTCKCICGQTVGLQNLFSLEYNNKKIVIGGDCIKKKCLKIVKEKILEKLLKIRKNNTKLFEKVITISDNTIKKYLQNKVKKCFNKLRFNMEASRPKNCECGKEIKGTFKQCYQCIRKCPKCECGKYITTKNKNDEYYKKCYQCNKKN